MRYPAPKIDTEKLLSALAETVKERKQLMQDLGDLKRSLTEISFADDAMRNALVTAYHDTYERLVEIDTRLYAVDVLLYVT